METYVGLAISVTYCTDRCRCYLDFGHQREREQRAELAQRANAPYLDLHRDSNLSCNGRCVLGWGYLWSIDRQGTGGHRRACLLGGTLYLFRRRRIRAPEATEGWSIPILSRPFSSIRWRPALARRGAEHSSGVVDNGLCHHQSGKIEVT